MGQRARPERTGADAQRKIVKLRLFTAVAEMDATQFDLASQARIWRVRAAICKRRINWILEHIVEAAEVALHLLQP